MLRKFVNKLIAFSNYLGNNSFLNIENLDELSVKKKVIFYTLAWGKYLDTYFNFTLPSIVHKSNIPKLAKEDYEISFILYTIENKNEIAVKYKNQIELTSPYSFTIKEFKKENNKVTSIANLSTINILQYCIDTNSILFMAFPDVIYSNNSIFNSVVFSYSKRRSFASAHPRINTKILKEFKYFPKDGFESTKLVAYALVNPHSSFKFASEKLASSTAYSGISYRQLSKSIFSVTSNIPSPFVVIPTIEDVNFFKNTGNFNEWDRGWLSFLLKKNRLKISGSSDMFFCVEITEENESNTIKLKKIKTPWNDLHGKVFSNRISNTVISIWRI